MTSFLNNGEYWQNWKFLDCQHTSPDEMGTEQQAPNTNMGQKTSLFNSDEMKVNGKHPTQMWDRRFHSFIGMGSIP